MVSYKISADPMRVARRDSLTLLSHDDLITLARTTPEISPTKVELHDASKRCEPSRTDY